MAFAARSGVVQSENDVMSVKDGKVTAGKTGQLLQQGSKRRAPLGDVSNVVPALSSRQAGGKDGKDVGAVKPAKAVPVAASKVSAKSVEPAPLQGPTAVAQPAAVTRPIPQAPRTRSQTKGLSMTSMLQTRSEAAVTRRQAPPSPLPDIDAIDRSNPLAMGEYVNDIYSFYKRAEPKYKVAPDYMKSQADINEKMRAILIDWLVEVHLKFKLMPETLFLTVNLIDRFLALKQVTRRNLQLVGVTCMLIGSKYEEIWAPEVRDFVYISDKAYTREQILECEKLVLNTLKFHLTLPTCYNFLARFLKASAMHLDRNVSLLASYLVELAIVDAGMLKYNYSMIACASVYTAQVASGKTDPFCRALSRHSAYSLDAILPCASALVELMQKAPTHSLSAVYKKYSSSKFAEVSKVTPPASVIEDAKALVA